VRLGAGVGEVLTDLGGELLAVRRHDVSLVDPLGVDLDPLDRGVRIFGDQ
jgi:hypothetical protein